MRILVLAFLMSWQGMMATVAAQDPAYSDEAIACSDQRSKCLDFCFDLTGPLDREYPATSPKRRCRAACHSGFFNCRQALDSHWRAGPERAQCGDKMVRCGNICTFGAERLGDAYATTCAAVCKSGNELCKNGEGFWLIWPTGQRERL